MISILDITNGKPAPTYNDYLRLRSAALSHAGDVLGLDRKVERLVSVDAEDRLGIEGVWIPTMDSLVSILGMDRSQLSLLVEYRALVPVTRGMTTMDAVELATTRVPVEWHLAHTNSYPITHHSEVESELDIVGQAHWMLMLRYDALYIQSMSSRTKRMVDDSSIWYLLSWTRYGEHGFTPESEKLEEFSIPRVLDGMGRLITLHRLSSRYMAPPHLEGLA